MHQCIVRLLNQPDDEESLECLCRLLTTIGKDLEMPMGPAGAKSSSVSVQFERMHLLSSIASAAHMMITFKTSILIVMVVQAQQG